MSPAARLGCAIVVIALADVAIGLCSGGSDSEKTLPSSPRRHGDSFQGPYCGIHSLYHALHAVGLPVDFASLVQDRYIGSSRGSSAEELQQAAIDLGAQAAIRRGLGIANLRLADGPILLHVRQPGQDAVYDHWLLFLGCAGDRARIVDFTDEVLEVPVAELLSLWDGVGLLVAGPRLPVAAYPASVDAALGLSLGLMMLLAAVIAFPALSRQRGHRPYRRMASEAIGIVLIACVASAIWHSARPEGYLFNRSAIGLVAEHRLDIQVPTISLEDLRAVQESDQVVIVDARLSSAYQAGHIPGAVSFPITAGWLERQEFMDKVFPSDKAIVIYCQSDACPWSGVIARAMMSQGQTGISVFAGGFEQWVRHGGKASRE